MKTLHKSFCYNIHKLWKFSINASIMTHVNSIDLTENSESFFLLWHAWTQSILLKILNNFFCYNMHFNSMLWHACYDTHELNRSYWKFSITLSVTTCTLILCYNMHVTTRINSTRSYVKQSTLFLFKHACAQFILFEKS